jgi:imidazolonepropionase-like amidohydrolase
VPALGHSVGDARTIDLNGAYLMPGLWDVHIHPDYILPHEMPLADQVTLFGHRLATALTESGITGMRCAGAHHFMDVAWKRAFDSGQHIGPRLFASGHFLTTTRGHFLISGHALEVDGPYGWVKAIREQIKNGVDHIKLNLSGGIMGPAWDLHTHSFLLEDELRAAFDICRKRGVKVMAHATNPEAVKNAVRLGAHSVEHGYIMDDECIALLLEHDTWYVPTLAISHLTDSQASNSFEADWAARAFTRAVLPRRGSLRRARHLVPQGARCRGTNGIGSDIRPLKDAALLEMGLWVRDGATPWQTLVAATRHGAAVCGVGTELGTVEVGKLADLIVVGANPLEDITNVRRLQLVLKEGRVVSDKRNPNGAVP